ncbi:phage tail sheath protein [Paenibacillaceae bacterium]|nr:phage tail sheath protein [Paenibacillaceae bacterium]
MAGGTFNTQNKIRPGVYINFRSKPTTPNTIGERGIVAFPASMPWGATGITIIDSESFETQSLALLGFAPSDARIRHIRAALSHARRVLIYRLGAQGAAKATATIGAATATAKYGGLRGNDLTVSVQSDLDNAGKFDVITYLDSFEVDRQSAELVEDLVNTDFITFTGTGELTASAGVKLTGGTTGTSTGSDYTAALAAFEAEEYNVIGIPTDDQPTIQLVIAYIKRLRDEGKKVVAVVVRYPQADFEGVISLKNGVITSDGLQVEAVSLVWEIAAMEAAAGMNEGLTYMAIPNAVEGYPKYTNSQIVQALRDGELIITTANGMAVIEQDINTLTSFTVEKGKPFSKNRVIRVLDGIANDLKRNFELAYLGKVSNNEDGRAMLRSEIVTYLEALQAMGAIQNFDPQSDILLSAGEEADSVYVQLAIQPVDSMEKIYMDVMVG